MDIESLRPAVSVLLVKANRGKMMSTKNLYLK